MLEDILKEEILIFEKALDLETQKRRAALSANGPMLQQLSQKSERHILELELLDKKLAHESRQLTASKGHRSRPSLKHLVEQGPYTDPKKNKKLQELAAAYKDAAWRLRETVQANQRFLENTTHMIGDILSGLQGQQRAVHDRFYGPKNSRPPAPANIGGSLFSAGA